MNYFKSKRQIIMAILLTLSVTSSSSYASNEDKCFPAGQEFFLDIGDNNQLVGTWYNNDSYYPYVYMFGSNKHNTWVKLTKYGGEDRKCLKFTVPQSGFSGLVFTYSDYDGGGFNNNRQQSTDITYDKSSNYYKFTGINGKSGISKITGEWQHKDYQSGMRIFIDVTNVTDWDKPAIYAWLDNTDPQNSDCSWIPMTQENILSNQELETKEGTANKHKYFSCIIPQINSSNPYGLIFTSQQDKKSSWSKCKAQTVDVMWDGYSNCYTLTGKNSSGKLIGTWSHIDLGDLKHEVIQTLVRQCVKKIVPNANSNAINALTLDNQYSASHSIINTSADSIRSPTRFKAQWLTRTRDRKFQNWNC